MQDGKGLWLIDEVQWDGRTGDARPARYLCNLLTNLGVEFAAEFGEVTLAAPDMVLAADNGAVAGRTAVLRSNGSLSAQVEFARAADYVFTVAASGTRAAGQYPNVRLLVDGVAAGDVQLQTGAWEELTYRVRVEAGAHKVELQFTNDSATRQATAT